MAANETENYEQLFNQIKTEIDKAAVAIRETKGKIVWGPVSSRYDFLYF